MCMYISILITFRRQVPIMCNKWVNLDVNYSIVLQM